MSYSYGFSSAEFAEYYVEYEWQKNDECQERNEVLPAGRRLSMEELQMCHPEPAINCRSYDHQYGNAPNYEQDNGQIRAHTPLPADWNGGIKAYSKQQYS